jgi:subtilisin family serine protease
MKRWLYILPALCAHIAAGQTVSFDRDRVNFGCVRAGDTVVRSVTVRNDGSAPLRIERLQSSCTCVRARAGDELLAGGGSTEIEISLDAAELNGNLRRLVYVYTNDPAAPRRAIIIKATVDSNARDAEPQMRPHQPGEVLVCFDRQCVQLTGDEDQAELDALARARGCRSASIEHCASNLARLTLNEGESVADAFSRLNEDPAILFAQPNFVYEQRETVPNDPELDKQYAIYNTGQVVSGQTGVAGADIQAADAWDISTGSGSVIVAVLDTGVDYNHPELQSQMWDGSDCLDANGNPLGDCIHGYDFSGADDKDPFPSGSNHGTHLAGIIGAVGNNGIGVAGVNWDVQIMAVRSPGLTTAELVQGIYFATHNGADVINASWGWAGATCDAALVLDEALYEAIAQFPGLFVGAAGNSNRNHNGVNWYDSTDYGHETNCWEALPNVINVAMSNNLDELSSNTDFGVNVDIAAPGTRVYSTSLGTGYTYKTGTSMSAPYVAGVAALAWDFRPDLSVTELREVLRTQGDCIPSMAGKLTTGSPPYCDNGGIRLNAYGVLASLANPTVTDLAAYTAPDRTMPVADGGLTADVQPYFEWSPPEGQGIIAGYALSIGNVFSDNAWPDAAFDAQAEGIVLTPGVHVVTVTAFNDRGAAGDPAGYTVVVTGDDPLVVVDPPAAANEGDTAVIEARLFAAGEAPVSVDYATGDQTATSGSDYVAAGASWSWAAGETGLRTVEIATLPDTIDEGNETFSFNVTPVGAVTIVNVTSTVEIIDDDPLPTISVEAVNVVENDGVAVLSLSLSNPSAFAISTNYTTIDGTAFAAQDYAATTGTVTWPPGNSDVQSITINLINNTTGEPEEQFLVEFDNTQNAFLAGTVAITVADDEIPSLSLSDATATELDGQLEVEVTLEGSSTATVATTVVTAGGTAAAGVDYEEIAAGIAWAPGESGQKTVQVPILDDTTDEHDESFSISLLSTQNATEAVGTAAATITDDDGPPFITAHDAAANENEGMISFNVELSEPSGKVVDFTYTLQSSSAQVAELGGDVVDSSGGGGSIDPGLTEQTISVFLANDQRDEGDEFFEITLNVDPQTVATDARSTLTALGRIIDNDIAFVLPVGWSMIGVPAAADPPTAAHSTILTDPRPSIWRWDVAEQLFVPFDELTETGGTGQGLFVNAEKATTVLLEVPLPPALLHLEPGWNIISVIAATLASELPAGIAGVPWTLENGGMRSATVLEPRRSYWVYVIFPVDLALQ